MKNRKLLQNGNSKLGPKVLTWSLPAKKTCKPSEWCSKQCYASKGFYHMPNVKNALETNLERSRGINFTSLASTQINASRTRLVRIHVSGDFYSEEYIDKWIEIAKNCPDSLFLFFTRRTDFKDKIIELASLDNVRGYESLDETTPARLIPEIAFATVEGSQWDSQADRQCNMGCQECNYKCWNQENKSVMFEKH